MLPRIPFGDALRPQFGRAPSHETAGPVPMTGKAAARQCRMARLASELCPSLPKIGEHVHCQMTGFFDLANVVCDVATRTRPRALRIATLAFNRRNILALLSLLDSRPKADPLPLVLLFSDYFDKNHKPTVDWAREQFADRPAKLASARSHCKVVCFDLGPGDGLVFEGSANLRTNRNREQLTIIRDRSTHDWHAGWIDQLAGGPP